MKEITTKLEATAKRERRDWIARGYRVSLIAYDPGRDVYAFNIHDWYDGPSLKRK